MNRQLRYLRERVVNALDMLRKGEFKSILVASMEGVRHTALQVCDPGGFDGASLMRKRYPVRLMWTGAS